MDHLTLTVSFASGSGNTFASDNTDFVFVDYNSKIDIEAELPANNYNIHAYEYDNINTSEHIDPMLNEMFFLTDVENEQNVII